MTRYLDLLPPRVCVKSVKSVINATCIPFSTLNTLNTHTQEENEPRLLHPQLRRALVRELWPVDGRRTFLLDTTVKAGPLLEACPKGIDPTAWREAVMALSRSLLGRLISRGYDGQPTLTFRTVLNPDNPQSVAQARQRFDAVVARWRRVTR